MVLSTMDDFYRELRKFAAHYVRDFLANNNDSNRAIEKMMESLSVAINRPIPGEGPGSVLRFEYIQFAWLD
jgi:hypothetical protein